MLLYSKLPQEQKILKILNEANSEEVLLSTFTSKAFTDSLNLSYFGFVVFEHLNVPYVDISFEFKKNVGFFRALLECGKKIKAPFYLTTIVNLSKNHNVPINGFRKTSDNIVSIRPTKITDVGSRSVVRIYDEKIGLHVLLKGGLSNFLGIDE